MFATSSVRESFCENYGAAGALLSLTGLCQLIYVMNGHWIGLILIGIYLFSVMAFASLVIKAKYAFPLIVTAAALVFCMTVFAYLSYFFSLILVILFIYALVIAVLIKTDGVDAYLRARQAAKDEELRKWDGIV